MGIEWRRQGQWTGAEAARPAIIQESKVLAWPSAALAPTGMITFLHVCFMKRDCECKRWPPPRTQGFSFAVLLSVCGIIGCCGESPGQIWQMPNLLSQGQIGPQLLEMLVPPQRGIVASMGPNCKTRCGKGATVPRLVLPQHRPARDDLYAPWLAGEVRH